MFSCEFCEIPKNTFLQRKPLVALLLRIYRGELISDFFIFLNLFIILNFAMEEWFSCNMFFEGLSFFFISYKYDIFVIKKFKSSRPDVFCKKVFSEILQNSQENTCTRVSFLTSLQG